MRHVLHVITSSTISREGDDIDGREDVDVDVDVDKDADVDVEVGVGVKVGVKGVRGGSLTSNS